MKCPFCGEEMVLGHIQPVGGRVPVWLPGSLTVTDLRPHFFTVKNVERAGGCVIGRAISFGVLYRASDKASRPDSMWCKKCDVLITKLSKT